MEVLPRFSSLKRLEKLKLKFSTSQNVIHFANKLIVVTIKLGTHYNIYYLQLRERRVWFSLRTHTVRMKDKNNRVFAFSCLNIFFIRKANFKSSLYKRNYRITSNKRPGRLSNFSDFRRGVYSRGAFIEQSEK